MEPVSKIAQWLRNWADKDLACAPGLARSSLGYVAAEMLENMEKQLIERTGRGYTGTNRQGKGRCNTPQR